MKVRLTATGTRPLLMHNVRLASPFNEYAQRMKKLNGKQSRLRTDEDRIEIARTEWEGGLYIEDGVGPYVPAANVFASLLKGAKRVRKGPKVEGGVVITSDTMCPLVYRGPRDIEGLWGGGPFKSDFVDIRTVSSNPSAAKSPKVDRCRPIFRDWAFEVDLFLDPTSIDLADFVEIADLAGNSVGIGDYRQLYGRFVSKVEPL